MTEAAATRVLIVEDQAIVARDLERCLCEYGYAVSGIVDHAEAAVRAVQDGEADLVLMDILLKGERDGVWAAQQIRPSEVPIVFLTAHGDSETVRRARDTGPYAYVLKPFDDGDLVRTIEIALSLRQVQSDLCRRETQQALERLSAGLAHAARNPLFGMTSALDGLEAVGGMARTPYHEWMRMGARRLEGLVARLEELGGAGGQRGSVDLRALIEAAAQTSRSESPAVAVEVAVAALPPVRADEARLAIAIRNLLRNAVEHSPRGRTPTVAASAVSHGGRAFVECVFTDAGAGFSPDLLSRPIEPFFSTRVTALGLGLAIADQVAREHGGTLELGNAAAGGARVVLRLPIA